MPDPLNKLPAEMIIMATEAARRERPDSGFTSSMHRDDRTGEVDKLLIYAWGPSAAALAKDLKLQSVMPAWARVERPPAIGDGRALEPSREEHMADVGYGLPPKLLPESDDH